MWLLQNNTLRAMELHRLEGIHANLQEKCPHTPIFKEDFVVVASTMSHFLLISYELINIYRQ